MYVLVGTQAKVKDDIWAGKTTCPKCGQVCNFHLAKLVQRITVFFIPIIAIPQKKYLVCDSCEWAKELSGKEYKEIKKDRWKCLKRESSLRILSECIVIRITLNSFGEP